MIYYILIFIAALVGIFIILEIHISNKFHILNTKISEAYNNMDVLFEQKANLLERAVNIIKENNEQYKEEILLDNLTKIKKDTLSRFELNHELMLGFRDYKGLIDLDTNLAKLESLKNINEELSDIDTDLNASKRYYNDNIVIYNNLVKCFPSNIVAKIHKYTALEFFKEEKIETLEILKEENNKKEEIKEEKIETAIKDDLEIKEEKNDDTLKIAVDEEFSKEIEEDIEDNVEDNTEAIIEKEIENEDE